MNAVEIRAAIDKAMPSNDRIDSIEMRGILNQILADGVTPDELTAMKSVLDDCWTEMYNAKETLSLAARELDIAGADRSSERYAKALGFHEKSVKEYWTASHRLDGVTELERKVRTGKPDR